MAKIHMQPIYKYIIIFFVMGLLLLSALSVDNILWIDASPEWETRHEVCNDIGCWVGPVENYTISEKFDYITKYRIHTVFTNKRDVYAAIIFGFASVLIVFFFNIFLHKRMFQKGLFS